MRCGIPWEPHRRQVTGKQVPVQEVLYYTIQCNWILAERGHENKVYIMLPHTPPSECSVAQWKSGLGRATVMRGNLITPNDGTQGREIQVSGQHNLRRWMAWAFVQTAVDRHAAECQWPNAQGSLGHLHICSVDPLGGPASQTGSLSEVASPCFFGTLMSSIPWIL